MPRPRPIPSAPHEPQSLSSIRVKANLAPDVVLSGPELADQLEISMSCFYQWVRIGKLPPPDPNYTTARWTWQRVKDWLDGDGDTEPPPLAQLEMFGPVPSRHRRRGPKLGHGGRSRKASFA